MLPPPVAEAEAVPLGLAPSSVSSQPSMSNAVLEARGMMAPRPFPPGNGGFLVFSHFEQFKPQAHKRYFIPFPFFFLIILNIFIDM